MQDSKVLYAYANSIFRTVVGTAMALVVIMLCAYPLSKKDIPGRTILTIFFLITMFFKGGLIPTYLLIKNLNLIDNRWVLILPNLMNVYYMIIMRNYLMSIDNALEESAFIDGGGIWDDTHKDSGTFGKASDCYGCSMGCCVALEFMGLMHTYIYKMRRKLSFRLF